MALASVLHTWPSRGEFLDLMGRATGGSRDDNTI
jgi:hypothetical protein